MRQTYLISLDFCITSVADRSQRFSGAVSIQPSPRHAAAGRVTPVACQTPPAGTPITQPPPAASALPPGQKRPQATEGERDNGAGGGGRGRGRGQCGDSGRGQWPGGVHDSSSSSSSRGLWTAATPQKQILLPRPPPTPPISPPPHPPPGPQARRGGTGGVPRYMGQGVREWHR